MGFKILGRIIIVSEIFANHQKKYFPDSLSHAEIALKSH